MEIRPGIHRIEAPLGNRIVCAFVLVGDEATLVFDTGLRGTPEGHIAPYFRDHHIDFARVRYILISHADFDHNGGEGMLKAMTPNALLMAHELDRAQIEDTRRMISERYNAWETDHGFASDAATDAWIMDNVSDIPVDMALTGGERIRLGKDWFVDVLHTPGHSWGHISLYDPRSKTALIADAALYNSVLTSDGKPAFPPTYRYLDTYVATVQHFLGMPIDVLLTSHYPVYEGGAARAFMGESLAYTQRVDGALADVLRAAGAPLTLKEIIAQIHTRIGDWPPGAESFLNFPLTGHLEQMEQYRKVELGRRDGLITYRWRDGQ
jgi:glyoxylase-like metal-dependent hydrolase (beta-lactamase superfamily II)